MIPLVIRTMRADDLDFAAGGTTAEGWLTETRAEFEAFLDFDPHGCFVAEWEGHRAGTCIAVRYGTQGHIGEVIVRREYRTRGLGRPLFTRAMAYLLGWGCDAISLDAVPRAVAFYESTGFRPVCRSYRLQGFPTGPPPFACRPMTSSDLEAVCSLDHQAFGADRSFFLRRRFRDFPDLAMVRKREGEIVGYIFGRRGNVVSLGPLWTKNADPEPAAALLRDASRASGAAEVRMAVLEIDARAVDLMRELGFVVKPHPCFRMVYGDVRNATGLSPGLFAIGTAAKG